MMNKKWHYTPRTKPDMDTIVIGFWINAENDKFVSLIDNLDVRNQNN